MSDRLTTQDDLFRRDLGSALSMERDHIGMLDDLERAAKRTDVKLLLRDNRRETEEQIENLERSFQLIGAVEPQVSSPVSQAIANESKTTIQRADQAIVDSVVVAETLQSEHYQVGLFERLVARAKQNGRTDVAGILNGNLTSAKATRDRVTAFAHSMN